MSEELRYCLNDCQPTIFVVYKDAEFWATSTTEDYSYVVLPYERSAMALIGTLATPRRDPRLSVRCSAMKRDRLK